MSESIQERIAHARNEAEVMKEKIKSHKDEMADTTCMYFYIILFISYAQSLRPFFIVKQFCKDLPSLPKNDKLKVRRTLKGHLAKIYAVSLFYSQSLYF